MHERARIQFDVGGRIHDFGHGVYAQVVNQRQEECTGHSLVPVRRSRRHEQLPVHQLVPVSVVGERVEQLHCPSFGCCTGHSHRLDASAPNGQEFTLYSGGDVFSDYYPVNAAIIVCSHRDGVEHWLR